MSERDPASRDEFERAALPYLAEIYRTAVGLLGNPHEAEDLAQDVFLQAWKSFHKFERGSNMRAWLHKILVFRASHFRRKFFRLRQFEPVEDEGNSGGGTPDIPDEAPLPDFLSDRQIMRALSVIPKPFRETLILADVREFTYQETAAMLGVPIGTVMSRVSRARRMMREALANIGPQTKEERGR